MSELEVITGKFHVVVKMGNRVFTGGFGGSGQLGSGSTENREKLEEVDLKFLKEKEKVKKVSCEHSYNTAITTTTGRLFACGNGEYGFYGDGKERKRTKFSEVEFYKGKNVTNCFTGKFALWVIVDDQKVYRSGRNDYGQLGNGKKENILVGEELDLSFLKEKNEKIVHIAGNYTHTLMVSDKNRVYCAGYGGWGKTGTNFY
jgi:alpha-tubulin suppressor-like RCC1 family protein